MFPRDQRMEEIQQHRLIRRGIPYGLPYDPAGGRGQGEADPRGLYFNAFMANIRAQFEFVLRRWVNNADFPDLGAGTDPIIGNGSQPVTLKRHGCPDVHLDLQRFVTTTGAIYAFAPSKTTLRRLAAGQV